MADAGQLIILAGSNKYDKPVFVHIRVLKYKENYQVIILPSLLYRPSKGAKYLTKY